MATLPEIKTPDFYEVSNAEYPTKTFLIDTDSKTISGTGEGLAAMEQTVQIALGVERYAYQIYTSNFGSELNGLIGKPAEYTASMLKRRIQETLSGDPRILGADGFVFDTAVPSTLKCSFQVHTVYGTVFSEVEI